ADDAVAARSLQRIAEGDGAFTAHAGEGGAVDGRTVGGGDFLHALLGARGVLAEAGGDGGVFAVGDGGRGEGADLHAGRSARRGRSRSRSGSLRRRSRRYGRG